MKNLNLILLLSVATVAGCTAGMHHGDPLNPGDDASVDNPPGPDASVACAGLRCRQVDCGEVGATVVSGTVFAPNGTLPIYNAVVFIPNSATTPFTDGVSCDRCSGLVSGNPIVEAVTGPDGKFSLTNVPVGSDVPLVIQIGKWRRQVNIPNVASCTTTALPAELTRLPKTHGEGDMPRMAIATGSVDPMECLLLKIGIDPQEITEPGNGTRIDFYKAANSPGTTISANTPSADDPKNGLYTDMKRLLNYDIVMLPCEGGEYDQKAGTANIVSYVNAGGRVFSTHYSYDWLTYTNSPFNRVAKPQVNGMWPKNQSDFPGDSTVTTAKLITNFPKGMAFAKWLVFAGAKSAPNTLDILAIRHDINGVQSAYAQPWATDSFNAIPGVANLTFNTPLDAPKDDGGVPLYCGRVVYSDFHVAQSQVGFGMFPGVCKADAMSDQEKALAFMLFDLSSCVLPDSVPPVG